MCGAGCESHLDGDNVPCSNVSNEGETPRVEQKCSPLSTTTEHGVCRVCGDGHAKMHYGVVACFGCKGFFRRALKRVTQYKCANNGKCVINKYERNSCRYCRLQRCLEVGMDPAAVRPDRDFTGPQHALRLPVIKRASRADCDEIRIPANDSVDWSKRLPVEMRTMLMSLLNIDVKVIKGDTSKKAAEVYPLPASTLRELIEDPLRLKGLRTEMRYEPYRMAENSELVLIAYRRLIAAVDWVSYLAEMMQGLTVEDKIALVKSCFAPLLVFTFAVRTAEVTNNPDVLCMCTFSYVPRNMATAYTDSYHLSNGLVERALDELVAPLRKLKLIQEEIVCLQAVIALNPHARDISVAGAEKVIELRNRIQETLHQVIKETRTKKMANVVFGNLLLFLSNVTLIANTMCENLQFAQTFSTLGSIPLLTNLFGCFPVEPLEELNFSDYNDPDIDERTILSKYNTVDACTQTDLMLLQLAQLARKRNSVEPTLLSPLENYSREEDFNLLQPPCTYTLTEMFDDRFMDSLQQQYGDQMIEQPCEKMDWSSDEPSTSYRPVPSKEFQEASMSHVQIVRLPSSPSSFQCFQHGSPQDTSSIRRNYSFNNSLSSFCSEGRYQIMPKPQEMTFSASCDSRFLANLTNPFVSNAW